MATYAIAVGLTPGPNNVYLLVIGVRSGIRSGLPYLMGIWFGFSLLTLVVALGISELFERSALAETIIVYLACGFLLYLAWQIARCAPLNTDPNALGGEHAQSPRYVGFVGGAVFQAINPKAWAAISAAVSLYMKPAENDPAIVFVKVMVFTLVTCTGSGMWLCFGTQLRALLSSPVAARYFNLLMALMLVGSIGLVLR